MGARNVAAAYAKWGHLPHAQFKLLVGMALQALDTATAEGRPPRVYFGGEDGLIDILGRSRTQMYRVLDGLRETGAVESLEAGRSGHRAVYRLHLDPFRKSEKGPADRDANPEGQGPADRDAKGSRSAGRKGSRSTGHTGSRSAGPLGTTLGTTAKSRPGETSPPEVPHQGAPTADAKTGDLDYDTASKIVQAAIGIEAATARIVELTVAGTDYETAMATLAREVQGKAGKR